MQQAGVVVPILAITCVEPMRGMKVSATEFNLLVEAMMRAMNTSELPVGVQNRILAIYAPMRYRYR